MRYWLLVIYLGQLDQLGQFISKVIMFTFFKQSILNKPRCRACHRGFTLAELIVVIGIMALIAGTSLVVFYSSRRKSDIKAYAEKTKDAIMVARSDAMNGSVSTSSIVDFNVAHKMKVNNIEVITFPSSITVSTNVPLNTFSFIADDPNQLGQVRGGNNPVICLRNPDNSARYNITVNYLTGNTTVSVSTSGGATCP